MLTGALCRTPSPSLCRLGRVSRLKVSEEDGEDDEQRRGTGARVPGSGSKSSTMTPLALLVYYFFFLNFISEISIINILF